MSGKATIHTEIDVNVVIKPGNIRPPVSMITINLAENKIPQIGIIIDPAHSRGKDSITDLKVPTIGAIKTWLDKCQEVTVDPDARCDITITSKDNTQSAMQQSVTLKGWIPIAAGMGSVGAQGNVAIEMVLRHPVGLLDRSVPNIGTVSALFTDWESVKQNNVVDGFINFYAKLAALTRGIPATGTASAIGCLSNTIVTERMLSIVAKALGNTSAATSRHLTWAPAWPNNAPGYDGYPLIKSCLTNYANRIKECFTANLAANVESSAWGVLTELVVPEYSLSVVPTYWRDQLNVTPFTPWSNPSIIVSTSEISEISFPGVDIDNIGGVLMIDETSPIHGAYSFLTIPDGASGDVATKFTTLLYIPPDIAELGMIGRILPLSAPAWLYEIITASTLIRLPQYMTPNDIAAAQDLPAPQVDKIVAENYRGALNTVAKQLFLTQFRASVEASLKLPLRIKAKGSAWYDSFVIPGCTYRIRSDTETTDNTVDLFDMYATEVKHVISVSPPDAYTIVSGKFCRPPGGIPKCIGVPTYNPMYEY